MSRRRYAHIIQEERRELGQTLADEYSAGMTIRALAIMHQISYGRTRRILCEAGTSLRPRGGWNRKITSKESGE